MSSLLDCVAQDGAGGAVSDVQAFHGTLPQLLDLTQANVLRNDMATLLGGTTQVVIDAGAVERMSTPCAQVLLAAGRAASAAGTFKVVNASDVFQTAIADLGLQSEFSQWMV